MIEFRTGTFDVICREIHEKKKKKGGSGGCAPSLPSISLRSAPGLKGNQFNHRSSKGNKYILNKYLNILPDEMLKAPYIG